ncbi:AMP-binding protein [Bradyrhizobium sp. Rc2d]|uniref:AMP-binding protein n=1 Tax=Bradyrhizobium sp. Rc2d TaxID=1855321 RepID=UPI001AEC7EB0|nr:AMP-binding protein [Bradyrhizobium sp. Rc2d]
MLKRTASTYPDRVAVFRGTTPYCSFRELADRCARMGVQLRTRLNIQPGDCIAIVSRNIPAFVEALFSCWYAGAVAVPINPKLHSKEIAFILSDCSARCCFISDDHREAFARLKDAGAYSGSVIVFGSEEYRSLYEGVVAKPAERRPEDVAWIFYTSGTTGRPKGAQLTHRNLRTMSLGYSADYERLQPGDSILHIGPMCHGSGLYILPHLAAGAGQITLASSNFDPAEVFDLIKAHPRIGFFAAPTIVRRLTEFAAINKPDTSNLRIIVYGGAPMYVEDLKRALSIFGPKFAQVYGQGETPMAISVLSREAHEESLRDGDFRRLATVGVPQSVVEVRIADDAGQEVPSGTSGEVLVRGDTVMKGYLHNETATKSALRDGWLWTGDVGVMDPSGHILLKDRSKDVIISGGSNIYPREVEEVLLEHAAVAEVSVIGVPDPEWGEVVVAFVVPRIGERPLEGELDRLCLDRIARYKRPKRYVFLDALPKSHLGKILKRELRHFALETDGDRGDA